MTERRAAKRHRALRSGLATWGGFRFTADCAVRDESADGVRLKVNSAEDIPAEFHLFDPRARLLRPGRVIWRAGREIGVHFQGPAFEPDRSADVRMARFAYL